MTDLSTPLAPFGRDIRAHLAKPIVLTGLMGAGKTTLGRMLAAVLDVPFYDSDVVITDQAGLTVPDIFSAEGEAGFRAREQAVIGGLLDAHRGGVFVLATGGGAVTTAAVADRVFGETLSVYMRAPVETLVARTKAGATARPLLAGDDPASVLAGLLVKREPIYARADIIFDSDGTDRAAVLARLVHSIHDKVAR